MIDRRAGGPLRTPAKYAALTARAARAARRADVIYAHYLFPTGAVAMAAAAGAARHPLRAHRPRPGRAQPGPPVAAAGHRPGACPVPPRLIAVSRHLADALGAAGLPLPPVHVIDMGVDLERFAPGDRAAGAGPPAGWRPTARWCWPWAA